MNTLLIFFAFPIAVIIISAILQKLLNNPIAVTALIFSIFLIVTFAAFDATFLIATLVYTLLALITTLIVKFICESNNNNNNACDILRNVLGDNDLCDALRNILNNDNNSNSNYCGCSRYRRYR